MLKKVITCLIVLNPVSTKPMDRINQYFMGFFAKIKNSIHTNNEEKKEQEKLENEAESGPSNKDIFDSLLIEKEELIKKRDEEIIAEELSLSSMQNTDREIEKNNDYEKIIEKNFTSEKCNLTEEEEEKEENNDYEKCILLTQEDESAIKQLKIIFPPNNDELQFEKGTIIFEKNEQIERDLRSDIKNKFFKNQTEEEEEEEEKTIVLPKQEKTKKKYNFWNLIEKYKDQKEDNFNKLLPRIRKQYRTTQKNNLKIREDVDKYKKE
jgi:hypothetical protein